MVPEHIYIVIAASVLIVWVFQKLFSPCRALNEFEHSDSKKKEYINKLRKQRRLEAYPPPYPNGWFMILQSHQLQTGESTEVYALGLNLVAWRGQSGQAYVADAYCPHLGAHLGVGGKVSKDCISCPFHGWTFEGKEGALTNIPYSKDEKFPNVKIKMHRILEQEGIIYIWYHAEGDEPTWFPSQNQNVKSGRWTCGATYEDTVEAHLQDIIENAADSRHFEFIHPTVYSAGANASWVSKFFENLIAAKYVGEWKSGSDSELKHITENVKSGGLTLLGKFKLIGFNFTIKEEGPGIMFIDAALGPISFYNQWFVTPIAPMTQQITFRFHTNKLISRLVCPATTLQIRWGLAQDKPIWSGKTYAAEPKLVREDDGIKRFRNYYSQFYSPKSLTMKQSMCGLDF